MRKSILVTGVGGVVGQGILRSLVELSLDADIIGTNIEEVSAGNYLCHKVYKVPYSYEQDYISVVKEICKIENVNLIIPATDYEAFYLSDAKVEFDCAVAASPAPVTKMCLDKFVNYQKFSEYSIPFAVSKLPSDYSGEFKKCIVKPREGRGSRNIFIDPENPKSFSDSYVVQEYLEGPEITTSFYIKRDGALHGMITFIRELEQGNTAKAMVSLQFDEELKLLVRKMLEHFDFKGSCNIQSRITENGIIPFEINCRISGTNSIRSQFGFNDVAFTVQEYFLQTEPDTPRIIEGTAIRVMLDIIYPGKKMTDIYNRNDNFYIR